MKRRIAYIMSRFPHLPETFILREMQAMENLGWDIALYPLIRQNQPVVHPQAQPWIPRARRLNFISPAIIAANARALCQRPRVYGGLWWRTLGENRSSPNFLIRAAVLMPQAVYAARLMQREGIVHIHAHYATHPALMAWIIHHLTGISYSITVHAHDIFVRTAMLATKLRDASFIAAISDYNRNHIVRLVGEWVCAKTHLVHCGIAPEEYTPRTQPHQVGERFEIISVGSLQAYKGHRYLIEACARLRAAAIPFHCRIIGDGAERARLMRLIAERNLGDQVELLGAQTQDRVAQLLPTAHCYVQPSIVAPSGKMEGIPVSLMEALACHLPVIATAISGIPELVRPAETGELVPPADADALADALIRVYCHPALAWMRAHAGRELVLREFDLQTNVRQLDALMERAVQKHYA